MPPADAVRLIHEQQERAEAAAARALAAREARLAQLPNLSHRRDDHGPSAPSLGMGL